MKNVRYLQGRVWDWVNTTFGDALSDTRLKGYRFIEEATELVEALGMSREEVHRVVDYVFDRERPGDPDQEIGGVMMTLAACASANELDIENAWGTELLRCEAKADEIRAKDDAKPSGVKA